MFILRDLTAAAGLQVSKENKEGCAALSQEHTYQVAGVQILSPGQGGWRGG